MKQMLSVFLNLLSQNWPLVLAAGVLGLLLLLVILRAVVRRVRGGSLPEPEAPEPSTTRLTRMASGSLMRLARQHYTVIDEVYVPRFEGEGSTRLDHVVISTHGIFVIHVQHERGDITGQAEHRHWSCVNDLEEKTLTNPIPRTRYHLRALARFLGLPEGLFIPVIYFENSVTLSSGLPAHVLTSGLGRHIISHKAELLSRELVADVSARLKAHQDAQPLEINRQDYAASRGRRLREVREMMVA